MSRQPVFEYDIKRGTVTFFAITESQTEETPTTPVKVVDPNDVVLVNPVTEVETTETTETTETVETVKKTTEETRVPYNETENVQLESDAYSNATNPENNTLKNKINVKNMAKKLEVGSYTSSDLAYNLPPESHFSKVIRNSMIRLDGEIRIKTENGQTHRFNNEFNIPDKIYCPPSPGLNLKIPKTIEEKLDDSCRRNIVN